MVKMKVIVMLVTTVCNVLDWTKTSFPVERDMMYMTIMLHVLFVECSRCELLPVILNKAGFVELALFFSHLLINLCIICKVYSVYTHEGIFYNIIYTICKQLEATFLLNHRLFWQFTNSVKDVKNRNLCELYLSPFWKHLKYCTFHNNQFQLFVIFLISVSIIVVSFVLSIIHQVPCTSRPNFRCVEWNKCMFWNL